MKRLFIFFVTTIFIGFFCKITHSQTSAWRQYRNNTQNTGYTSEKAPGNPSVEKQIGLTGHVAAAPVVDSKGNIYVSCQNDTFYAFNPNLTARWKKKLRLSFNAGGSNSHPALSPDESTVYIFDWNEGKLNAFNAASGNLVWKSEEFVHDYGTGVPKVASNGDICLVHGDIIYIGSNGITKWRNKTDQFHYWAAFPSDEKSIYVGSYSNIYTFDIAGGNPTKYQFSTQWAPYPVSVDKNGILYGGFGNYLRAYQRNTNTHVWRYSCKGDHQNVAVDDVKGRVYVVNDDSIHALNFNGSLVWKKKIKDA
jgi:DNA-binding beta-propeller fold protein YncE